MTHAPRLSPLLAGAALACALAAGPAAAQPYPPEYRWRTFDTEHFRIHFPEGYERMAAEVRRAAERAYEVQVPAIGHAPRGRTELVISDEVDDANGSATPLPYNTIRLYAVPPAATSELADERAWIDAIVLHEFVHILHLDTAGGIPGFVDLVFGRLWYPNVFVPGWMIEGLAVTHEAGGEAGTGRNDSALHDMYVRAMAADGGLPRLDQISNPSLEWPLGQIPYVLGGRFMAWIEHVYGRTALVGYLKDQGSSLWPYAPSWNGEDWFGGKSFRELWNEFDELERKAAEQHLAAVRARPAVPFTRLTALGGGAENPRFTPDGQAIVFFHRSLHERSGLWRVPAAGGEAARAVKVDQNGTFSMAGPGRLLVAATELYREFRAWDDLWLADLATGARRRLTTGERTTEPDLMPDGTVVHVRNVGDGGKALVRRRLEHDRLGPAEVLFEEAGAEVFNPRLSPDGRRVAFSLQRAGRLDLALWEDGKVRLLTDDDALDLTPAWSPDGATLYFASDRLGAFDVYAMDPATGAARRVTNAETGALWPDVSPDGKTLAFLTYSRAGYDVATLALEPAAFVESPAPPAEPRPVLPAPAPRLGPAESRPYSALGTLGPTFWFPVLSADATGNTYGLVTGGADVLVRHVWLAQGWWSEHGHTPGYSLTYQGRWSWPWLDLSTSRSVVSSPDPVGRNMDAWTVADAGATFTWSSMERSLALRLGWAGTIYDTHGTPPSQLARPDLRFGDGFLSSATATLQYSDARRFVHSVSPEEGRTAVLSLRVAEPGLGSDYTLNRLRLSVSQYLRVPFTRHAVLMVRASGGAAHGHAGDSAPFSIGGPSTDLNVLDYLLGAVPDGGAHALRGYASGALAGTAYYLGTAELRFPIAETALGFSTWPVYLRRVHGAAFADAGDAFDRPGELRFAGETGNWRNTRVGVGGELRLEVVFGYNVRADVRIGAARPLGPVDGGRARDLAELGEAPGARFYVTLVLL